MRRIKFYSISLFFILLFCVAFFQLFHEEWRYIPRKIFQHSSPRYLEVEHINSPQTGVFQIYEISTMPFENKEKAIQLYKLLLKKKFQVYWVKYYLNDRILYIIKIGPFLNVDEANLVLKNAKVFSRELTLKRIYLS